jgi:hypothetical protein
MTHSATALSQHLLTRSDLAKLGISAGSILAWLADRLLEPVGSLPGADAEHDEVFAVPDRDHRVHLAGKLEAIGKKEIVFSPARVWSLMRCAMTPASGASKPAADSAAPVALDVTWEMLAHDAEAFVEMTRQEALLEAREAKAPAVKRAGDAEDLIGELGTWGAAATAASPEFVETPAGAAPTAAPRSEPAVAQAMTRVESFLGELRQALVELAGRPQPQPVDVQPLVAAVQSGFVHSAEQLGDLGKRVEASVASAVRTALDHEGAGHGGGPTPASIVVPRTDRSTTVLFAIGFLLLCWTAIFWFKTGSPKLAFGTLVGANLVGCCLVAGRQRT